MSWRAVLGVVALVAAALLPASCDEARVKIASKKFTESVILGEMAAHLARDADESVAHFRELGGSRFIFEALLEGQIDLYFEYTGTLLGEILVAEELDGIPALRAALARRGIGMSESLGFNNTYAFAMRESEAAQRDIRRISDLARHPDLVFGFSNEFLARADGWPGIKKAYELPHDNVRGMDHDVAYRQLEANEIQVMEVYSTDADVRYYGLRVLEDDRSFFPRYDAVLLYRNDLEARAPAVVAAVKRLTGAIGEEAMVAMNGRAKLRRIPESRVAAEFVRDALGVEIAVEEETLVERLWRTTREHLHLVRVSLALALLLAIPLGIVAARRPRLGHAILGGVGVVQTIPALALLVMLIKPVSLLGLTGVGTGAVPAIIALFVYSLLPIVRNTCVGIRDIPPDLRESAMALGLSSWARLRRVELPLALPTILAGVKTAAVVNVGFATLGALVGAGGYGQPILTGIRLDRNDLILEGALPAALLALLVQSLFDLLERVLVPRSLRG